MRPRTPQAKFDTVAPHYDLLNSALSAGLDRRWRRHAARALEALPGARILDVATGTASLARAILAASADGITVVGFDCNLKMLSVGRRRLGPARPGRTAYLLRARGETIPFRDATFDGATIAFAIDDMEDRGACAREILRVLRPGGRLVLLELSLPEQGVLRALYRGYLRVFPLVGRLLSRGGGYEHLREEIITYRGREAIRELLMGAGFTDYTRRSLTGGIVTLHRARKPALVEVQGDTADRPQL